MSDLISRISATVAHPNYHPVKPKALARKLGLPTSEYENFKDALKELIRQGRLEIGKGNAVRPLSRQGTVTGVFRKATAGFGFVRPNPDEGHKFNEVFIPEEAVRDAATGDIVQVRLRQSRARHERGPKGDIIQVLERATSQFVGTYFTRDGQFYVRVDGTVFSHSVLVGDPSAKGAKPNDKVVIEMLRFPTADDRGEAVITEVLGAHGKVGVDTLSVIRALGIPDSFPEDVLTEARLVGAKFTEEVPADREDFTDWLTITIDPVDARDFDDAISLTVDPKSKHWLLGVHIADVSHFAPPGSALDREARRRGTSVYLPQRVIPMFPELISNGLASLQEAKVRYVKSAIIDLTPTGQKAHVRFANGVIKTRRRFPYEEVSARLAEADGQHPSPPVLRGRGAGGEGAQHPARKRQVTASEPEPLTPNPSPLSTGARGVDPDVHEMVLRMRDLALIMHKRRVKRGALELSMPEIGLEYDDNGKVCGAHFRKHDISHQIVEEFMLAANEAVAEHLDHKDIYFLRRVHPAPEPTKLQKFAEFARILGYKMKRETDRFSLQRILQQSATKPEMHAVHYALLRSLKQATYSPVKDDHYALALENYCHFTSPIRRYPDLQVHRLLDQLFRRGKAGSSLQDLQVLGEHCSKTERRAETAERELVKHKLLVYMNERVGTDLQAVITGVADYGFYAQAETLPVEGLVHISTLPDDYYYFEDASHSLVGQRSKRQYRLGDKVEVTVVRVDLQRRQLDFRIKGTMGRLPNVKRRR
ncbi:MAG TPA: RNB domain-containing ribonuclease [Gemmataceae bacterium]|nr:RNB domain-containing ribonuclease [Gemmataceae bacterium]